MPDERIVLWRWAKPTKVFEPEENPQPFRFHKRVVLAGLKPFDWEEMMSGEGVVLHKIVLNMQQAKSCVVAEAEPSEKKVTEFIERRYTFPFGSIERYQEENYEKSFVPLLEYSGGYNLPEVLIPFPVKAKVVSKIELLFLKLRVMERHSNSSHC